ncbi:MAG: hypothetical protein Q8P12_01650, partial [bacterium]|nr:hypothetical protein [bacterium]
EPSRTFELGITAPIVVGAGIPLKEGGEVIGAVFAARLVDQDFLLKTAEKFNIPEIGLYCNCGKIYISTIRNVQNKRAVQNFLEHAFTDEG